MTRRALKFSITAGAFLTSMSVFAADLPIEPILPEEPCVERWSCFYFGGNLGAAWDHNSEGIAITVQPQAEITYSETDDDGDVGLTAGVQVGWNTQIDEDIVLGVEADLNYLGLRSDSYVKGYFYGYKDFEATGHHRLDWFGTLRGRVGMLVNPELLVYVTGGLAGGRARTDLSLTVEAAPSPSVDILYIPATVEASESQMLWGWTIGAGLEYALDANWSIKGEYLYVDLEDTALSRTISVTNPNFDVTGTVHDKNRFSVVRAGVNYKF